MRGAVWPDMSCTRAPRPGLALVDADASANDVTAAAVWRRPATEGEVLLGLPASACAAATAR